MTFLIASAGSFASTEAAWTGVVLAAGLLGAGLASSLSITAPGRVHGSHPPRSRRTRMDDVLYLGLTALFFLIALLVVKGVNRL